MAELTKVPDGKRYVCDLVAFEAGSDIAAEWRGKGQLVDVPQRTPRSDGLTWQQERAKQELASSDEELIRVIEDVVNTLVTKGVITMSDLPSAAADKLTARAQQRAGLAKGSS